jgi:hypothetical protein
LSPGGLEMTVYIRCIVEGCWDCFAPLAMTVQVKSIRFGSQNGIIEVYSHCEE